MKKVRIFAVTACILVFSLILTACDSLSFFPQEDVFNPTDPEKPVVNTDGQIKRIMDLIEQDDNERLYQWVHPDAQKRYGREQIIERADHIHQSIGLKSIELKDFSLMDNNAKDLPVYRGTVIYDTAYGRIEQQTSYTFRFHPAEQTWKLDWTPSVILPGLHENGTVQILPQKARRGHIFDRAGRPLAQLGHIQRVSLVPGSFDKSKIPEIEEYFELPEGFIQKKMDQPWVTDYVLVPLFTDPDLTDDDRKKIAEFTLSLDVIEQRVYPGGEALSHLIGYVGLPSAEDLEKEENAGLTAQDYIGKAGLESIYDQRLRGKSGFKIVVTGEYEQVLLEDSARDGEDIYLTIDAALQQKLYNELKDLNSTLTAINPQTGEILALISTPGYDTQAFVSGISQEDYDQLLNNPDKPLFNKFQNRLTPGSTMKILTAIAGLNAGTLTPETTYEIIGKGWQPDSSWGNYEVKRFNVVDGEIGLEDAVVYSDNIYFARVALDMGAENFREQMEKLGFHKQLVPDYPFQQSMISESGSLDNTILLADAGYGQGQLQITPVNLASVVGSIAAKGKWVEPHLDRKTEPEILTEHILPEDQTGYLAGAMRKVVTQTYAETLNRENIALAGKSGTAERGLDESGTMRLDSWFVAYDQDNPNLVMALTVFDAHKFEVGAYAAKKIGELFDVVYEDGPYTVPE